jgi:DNA-directed RNA polymerase specialized sigma24 family protein
MDVLASVPDSGEPPDHAVARTQMRSVLERKVNELPEIFRVVFVLRSVEELSIEETADSLAIPQETVRTRHFRAKGMLRWRRRLISQRAISSSLEACSATALSQTSWHVSLPKSTARR